MRNKARKIACLMIVLMLICAAANAQESRHASTRLREVKAPLPKGRYTALDVLKSFVGMEQFAELEFDVIDIPNGYLSFSRPASDVFDETFALFRCDDDTAVIAYAFIACGPACAQEISFFRIDANAFPDITHEVIAEEIWETLRDDIARAEQTMEYAGPLFVLPHYGTTIEVWLADDGEQISTKLMDLRWNGREFMMNR